MPSPTEVANLARQAADIVEFAADRVPLRRRGATDLWQGRCPFHAGRGEDFVVSAERRFYYCYACRDAGDVLRLAERLLGLPPEAAARALAERFGVEVPEELAPEVLAERRRARDLEARIRAACEAAAAFFEASLKADGPGPEVARAEIERRAVDPVTAARFRLGYAPAAWRDLAAHLRDLGVSPADAETAGLLMPGRVGGYHDRFRHRLMFPVCDTAGRVVAFSGRALPDFPDMTDVASVDTGKYINSPETPIFRKGATLYGMHLARGAVRRAGAAVLVEGNFDVVGMHARGFERAVAPLGTSFTAEQAAELRRHAPCAIFAFDGDRAGAAAFRAAAGVARAARLEGRAARLPAGQDPDSLLRAQGPAAMAALLGDAPDLLSWLIDDEAADAGATVPERVGALRRLAPILAAVDDPVERDAHCAHTARALLFEASVVHGVVAQFPAPPATTNPAGRDRQEQRMAVGLDLDGAPGEAADARAFACALAATLSEPALLLTAATETLTDLLPPAWRPFLVAAADQWTARRALDGAALLGLAPHRPWAARALMPRDPPLAEGQAARALAESVRTAEKFSVRRGEGMAKRAGERDIVSGEPARGERSFQDVLAARRARARSAAAGPPPAAHDDPLPEHLQVVRGRLFGDRP